MFWLGKESNIRGSATRQLSDDELLGLARQTSGLTDVAQQVLTQEIVSRRLKIPPEERAAPH